jgi:2-polyprenyl-6-methoxyphenol hydroxylase-like FAD-dependent oxidoreductase
MEVAANGVFVDRTRFRNALLAKNRFSVIWNKRFVKYEERSSGVVIHFADGTVSEEFDVVVGADGANSVFRKQYVQPAAAGLPRPFEYSDLGFTNIAGMLPAASPSVADSIRALTKPGLVRWLGQDGHTVMMFQFVDSLTSESVLLWVLSFPGKAEDWKGRFTHPDDVTMEEYSQSLHFREQLLEWSASHVVQGAFSETVLRVIKGTPADSRLYGPRQIYSLPSECIKPALLTGQKFPTSERLRRVFILGDAAHATTTHRGLGANTAIADAADLCDAFCRANDRIAAGDSLETVNQGLLQEYDEKMVQRATKVAEGSLQSTQMIHATGFFATWIRPFMLGVFHYMFRMFPSMAQQ